VANEVLERQLTSDEITAVGNAVGDYLDWFQAIENAILPLHSKRERRIDDVRTSAAHRWTRVGHTRGHGYNASPAFN
jgi:hypothetical protein